MYVQFGSHFCSPEGWMNFDSSPTMRLQRLPIIGGLMQKIAKAGERFPAAVQYGDIVAGLPLPKGSAKAVYASHVLEHLSYADFKVALKNTYDLMAPGAVFRLIVPDLAGRVRRYVDAVEKGDGEAAPRLMRETLLGIEARPRGLVGMAKSMFGNAGHYWMWDEPSMRAALEKAGFVDIRAAKFGDSGDPMFERVESEHRFKDLELEGLPECALECRKPG